MRKLGWFIAGIGSGFGVGVAAGFVRADRIRISGVMIHYGIFLAIAGVLVIQLWLARRFQSRWIAIGYAVGWITSTILLGASNGNGDLVLPGSALTAAYVLLGAIGVSMFAALPPMRLPLDEDVASDAKQATSEEVTYGQSKEVGT